MTRFCAEIKFKARTIFPLFNKFHEDFVFYCVPSMIFNGKFWTAHYLRKMLSDYSSRNREKIFYMQITREYLTTANKGFTITSFKRNELLWSIINGHFDDHVLSNYETNYDEF